MKPEWMKNADIDYKYGLIIFFSLFAFLIIGPGIAILIDTQGPQALPNVKLYGKIAITITVYLFLITVGIHLIVFTQQILRLIFNKLEKKIKDKEE